MSSLSPLFWGTRTPQTICFIRLVSSKPMASVNRPLDVLAGCPGEAGQNQAYPTRWPSGSAPA